ncbi:MAG: hypothetical protein AAGE05_11235 [Pseudomonadota bacterium]
MTGRSPLPARPPIYTAPSKRSDAFATHFLIAEESRIDYVYFNSLGGVSRGSMQPTETGFSFPDENYQAPDGTTRTMQSSWTIDGDRWQQNTREGDNLVWQVDYERRPLSDYPPLSRPGDGRRE